MAESAFIVRVPEAEPFVAHWRDRMDPSARLGVPAHITVLHPFMSPERVTTSVREQIAGLTASMTSFEFRLSAIRRFPGALCLDPDPAAAIVALTERLVARFPDYPASGGKYRSIIPHLTVARGCESDLNAVESALKAAIGTRAIAATFHELVLIENASGVWRVMHAFPIGRAGAVFADH